MAVYISSTYRETSVVSIYDLSSVIRPGVLKICAIDSSVVSVIEVIEEYMVCESAVRFSSGPEQILVIVEKWLGIAEGTTDGLDIQ